MPMEDDFTSDNPLPLFLSGHADENEERGSFLLLSGSILLLVASLVGMAISLSWGNPVKVLAAVTASLTNISAVRATQLTANAQGLPPTAKDSSGALLKQFQAWAAKQDVLAQVAPVSDARAQDQSVQNAQAPSFLQRWQF